MADLVANHSYKYRGGFSERNTEHTRARTVNLVKQSRSITQVPSWNESQYETQLLPWEFMFWRNHGSSGNDLRRGEIPTCFISAMEKALAGATKNFVRSMHAEAPRLTVNICCLTKLAETYKAVSPFRYCIA